MEKLQNENKITSLDKLFKTYLDYHNSKLSNNKIKLKYIAPFNVSVIKRTK